MSSDIYPRINSFFIAREHKRIRLKPYKRTKRPKKVITILLRMKNKRSWNLYTKLSKL